VALICASLLAQLPVHSEEVGATGARAVVETLHSGLIAASSESATLQARYQRLQPVIAATHDLAYIAELTIRRQWRTLDQADRDRFVAAFERLSVMTYASRFTGVDESSFTIVDVQDAGAGRIQVSATISPRNGTDVPLDYTLEDRGQGWRIVNIFADGVSDLALKRAEYQRVLSSGTLDTLIETLNEQTASLQ
jgi:phospholipid transport system substrate-binding protein